MLAAGDMASLCQAQCLIPADVSYLLELKLVIALLPRMIITGSHLYIWLERGTVKENCLSQDEMTTP